MSLLRNVGRKAAQVSGAAAAVSGNTCDVEAESVMVQLRRPLHLTLDGARAKQADQPDDDFDFCGVTPSEPVTEPEPEQGLLSAPEETGAECVLMQGQRDTSAELGVHQPRVNETEITNRGDGLEQERSMALRIWNSVPAVAQANASATGEASDQRALMFASAKFMHKLMQDEGVLAEVNRLIEESKREEELMDPLRVQDDDSEEKQPENEEDAPDSDSESWLASLWNWLSTKLQSGSRMLADTLHRLLQNILGSDSADKTKHSPTTVIVVGVAVVGLVLFTMKSAGVRSVVAAITP